MPISVLFVCLGNICRSPMAEAVFTRYVYYSQYSNAFKIDSAGTSGFHQGELSDSRMRFHASKRGYELTHRSRKFSRMDFDLFDYIIVMDDRNYDDVLECAETLEDKEKVHRMVEFSRMYSPTHIPDPYCGGSEGFNHVIDLLEDACRHFFDYLTT